MISSPRERDIKRGASREHCARDIDLLERDRVEEGKRLSVSNGCLAHGMRWRNAPRISGDERSVAVRDRWRREVTFWIRFLAKCVSK